MTQPTLLQARQLNVERNRVPVVQDLSLELTAGTWTALVGPNGAGKSTAMAGLAGVLACRSGEVRLGDRAWAAWSPSERARQLAWLSQQGPIDADLTVRDVVMLGRLPHHGLSGSVGPEDHHATDQALLATGCSHLGLRRLGELSGGERQRVLIARVLATHAAVMLMDEPCAFLDPQHRRQLLGVIRSRTQAGDAFLTAEHDLTHALRADRLVVMDAGRIRTQGAAQDPGVHRALIEVFDGAIRIEPMDSGRSWVVLPLD